MVTDHIVHVHVEILVAYFIDLGFGVSLGDQSRVEFMPRLGDIARRVGKFIVLGQDG